MLLTGEAGCDLDRLARAVHGMTPRRLRSPIELGAIPHDHAARTNLIQQASKTSLILSLDDESEPLPPDVVSKLFDARLGVRFIAIASSPNIARRVLTGAKVGLMQHVPVRPLADRRNEIRKLLDRQFAKRGSCRRVNDLTPENQDALKTYAWPGNFAELREVVDGIIAHAKLGGLRPAAESLGISHQKLDRRFRRVGLKIRRLFGEGE
jgi:DNA-binding NtrC family response regulator